MSVMSFVERLLLAMALGAALLWASSVRAGGVSTNSSSITGSYSPSTLGYIAAKGGMPTEIIGNPFAVPKDELEAIVNQVLERSHPGPRFPFFSEVPPGVPSPYRVVILLNQPGTHSGPRLCRDSYRLRAEEVATAAPGGPGEVRVVAAFCAREIHISSVRGVASGVHTPQDGSFRRLLSQVGHALLPRTNPERRGGRNRYY
jgi:hypothetical protein